jgi:hypothetical protein
MQPKEFVTVAQTSIGLVTNTVGSTEPSDHITAPPGLLRPKVTPEPRQKLRGPLAVIGPGVGLGFTVTEREVEDALQPEALETVRE